MNNALISVFLPSIFANGSTFRQAYMNRKKHFGIMLYITEFSDNSEVLSTSGHISISLAQNRTHTELSSVLVHLISTGIYRPTVYFHSFFPFIYHVTSTLNSKARNHWLFNVLFFLTFFTVIMQPCSSLNVSYSICPSFCICISLLFRSFFFIIHS